MDGGAEEKSIYYIILNGSKLTSREWVSPLGINYVNLSF